MKICKHFSECGGCRFQDVAYRKQLKHKANRLKHLMGSYGLKAKLKSVNYRKPWYYRNKMEFTFSDRAGEVICGLYGKNRRSGVVDIEECRIFSPDTGKILKTVKAFSRQKGYPAYDKYSHRGFLRYLIIRETKFAKEVMVGVVTSSQGELDKNNFVNVILALRLRSKVKSIYWVVNDSFGDAVGFEKKELLFGKEFIREKLGRLTFNIGIDTFFQVNPALAARFYQRMTDYAALSRVQSVLDLFSGAGGIGLFLADKAKFVWGVEASREIVEIARCNATANKIKNIAFFVAEARKFLNTQGAFYKGTDLLVVNPPRCGLSGRAVRAILRLKPRVIFYSSCNPDTLFENLKVLLSDYTLDFIEPFDFFPHTPHLECLSVLSSRRPIQVHPK